MEIRDSDLRFSEQDGALFLSQTMGLHLEEEDVVLLTERTEGWIAGLQLAALSLRGHDDPSAFLKGLSGSHRFLLDYVQEVDHAAARIERLEKSIDEAIATAPSEIRDPCSSRSVAGIARGSKDDSRHDCI